MLICVICLCNHISNLKSMHSYNLFEYHSVLVLVVEYVNTLILYICYWLLFIPPQTVFVGGYTVFTLYVRTKVCP